MKKRIEFACIAVMIVALCFVGCDIADDGEKQTVNINYDETYHFDFEKETMELKDWFNTDPAYFPTDAEVERIIAYMPAREIVNAIGKPYSFGRYSGAASMEWHTQEGGIWTVIFGFENHSRGDVREDMPYCEYIMKYGITVSVRKD